MLDSILESLHVVDLPTKTNFRGVTSREVALFQGPAGWGEFSPFLEYSPKESVPWLVSAVEAALISPPTPLRDSIQVNATLPAINGDAEIAEVLSWYPGCTTVKIKVGGNLIQDLDRIGSVRTLAPDIKIRIDVNANWSVDEALRAIGAISEIGSIEYVEQPCSTLDELRELKRKLPPTVLIAGDEVVRKASHPMELNLAGAVDIVILKVAPLGGIKRSLEIAKKHSLPTVVSSALESAVGISYGLALASATLESQYACGLATGALLRADVAASFIAQGSMKVGVVEPSTQLLASLAVSQERLDWWRGRIRDTWLAGSQQWVEREGWAW